MHVIQDGGLVQGGPAGSTIGRLVNLARDPHNEVARRRVGEINGRSLRAPHVGRVDDVGPGGPAVGRLEDDVPVTGDVARLRIDEVDVPVGSGRVSGVRDVRPVIAPVDRLEDRAAVADDVAGQGVREADAVEVHSGGRRGSRPRRAAVRCPQDGQVVAHRVACGVVGEVDGIQPVAVRRIGDVRPRRSAVGRLEDDAIIPHDVPGLVVDREVDVPQRVGHAGVLLRPPGPGRAGGDEKHQYERGSDPHGVPLGVHQNAGKCNPLNRSARSHNR